MNETNPPHSPHSRIWEMRKEKLIETFETFSDISPVMWLMELQDLGDELRAIVEFHTKTLVKQPGKPPEFVGPVLTGIRYHQSFQSQAPVPWEIVTVLYPMPAFHPNINRNGGLCLGKPPANVPMDLILHLTWAALVLNTRLVTTTDWQVFNPEAAAYVRAHSDQFPLTERGLLEPLPDKPKPDDKPESSPSDSPSPDKDTPS